MKHIQVRQRANCVTTSMLQGNERDKYLNCNNNHNTTQHNTTQHKHNTTQHNTTQTQTQTQHNTTQSNPIEGWILEEDG